MTNSEKLTSGVVMNIPQGIDRRVAKNGEISYRVRIRIKDHQSFSKTFKHLTHAKQWKRITESSVEKGEYVLIMLLENTLLRFFLTNQKTLKMLKDTSSDGKKN